jgi:hypothetical protein
MQSTPDSLVFQWAIQPDHVINAVYSGGDEILCHYYIFD